MYVYSQKQNDIRHIFDCPQRQLDIVDMHYRHALSTHNGNMALEASTYKPTKAI